jgi:hypothetical protein
MGHFVNHHEHHRISIVRWIGHTYAHVFFEAGHCREAFVLSQFVDFASPSPGDAGAKGRIVDLLHDAGTYGCQVA